MDLNYTPYNIVTPSLARATGAPAELEPEEDNAKSAYVVRVYIHYRGEVSSFCECELVESFGIVHLKTRRILHGQKAAWTGYLAGIDRHPELETLYDRAQAAVERYFEGKSAAWWKRIRTSILRYFGLAADISVRMPRRKDYIVLARVELVTSIR